MTAFPPLDALVPHRGRMLLIDAVLAHAPDTTTCGARIAPDSIVVRRDGTVARWAALEYLAQTVAVHAGLSAWARGEPPKLGFLIGSKRVEFHRAPPVGRPLCIVVRRVWGQASLGLFECALRDRDADAVLAEGELTVALADAIDRFGGRAS
jgi:predicted hotdog family 3-hydroxylacyl-ACP dehydratase